MFNWIWILSLLQVIVIVVGTSASQQQLSTSSTVPTVYYLQLNLNYVDYEESSGEFHARLSFQFSPLNNSQFIQLTASRMNIDELKIYDNSTGNLISIRSVKVLEDRWKIRLVDQVYANRIYNFKIGYYGTVDEKSSGFIVVRYNGRDGKKRYLLTSNPTKNFSLIMPHLTEQQTGSLELSVNVPLEWTAVFNSIELDTNHDVNNPRMNLIRFKSTRQMKFDDFLLVIGNLSSSIGYTKFGSMVRSFIPRDFDDFLEETAKVPVNCLSSAESYLEQPIQADKIDHLNILEDWSFTSSGIVVHPAQSFSFWPQAPASDLLEQKLLVCKQTIRSWLSMHRLLENGSEMIDALAIFLSYRLVTEFEDSEYANVVNEEIVQLSNATQLSSNIQRSNENPKHSSQELAAIFLMLEDALGVQVFVSALGTFVEKVQRQQSGDVFSTLIEAFREATNYTPLCQTMMVQDFINSWLNNSGPAQIEISLKNGTYSIQQTSCPLKIVPLIVKELGGKQLPVQWLMPSGRICSQFRPYFLDSRTPYTFNSNGKAYTRIDYSIDIHKMFIDDGIYKMSAGAQFTYIRDLSTQLTLQPEKLSNLIEFVGQSFTHGGVGSPLFVQEAFQLLHHYSNETDKQIEDVLNRQVQNLHNSILWRPNKQTLRNAMLSEQLLYHSVLNKVSGSRFIASNFYKEFLLKCAPNFECSAFPVEILSAVLCNSVIGNEDSNARTLLAQMIIDLEQKHNLILYAAARRILNSAWQCVYES